jgi:predicted NodU family carbamoyl transferase
MGTKLNDLEINVIDFLSDTQKKELSMMAFKHLKQQLQNLKFKESEIDITQSLESVFEDLIDYDVISDHVDMEVIGDLVTKGLIHVINDYLPIKKTKDE